MSFVRTYVVPGNDLSQLHDALLRAGIVPELVQGLGDDITLTLPDGTVEATVDAIVAAHIPMTRYDPATQLATNTRLREAARLRADYERLAVLFRAVAGASDLAAAVDTATTALIDVLKRRDRAAGLY